MLSTPCLKTVTSARPAQRARQSLLENGSHLYSQDLPLPLLGRVWEFLCFSTLFLCLAKSSYAAQTGLNLKAFKYLRPHPLSAKTTGMWSQHLYICGAMDGPREHDVWLNESDVQRKEVNDLIHDMDSEKESNI